MVKKKKCRLALFYYSFVEIDSSGQPDRELFSWWLPAAWADMTSVFREFHILSLMQSDECKLYILFFLPSFICIKFGIKSIIYFDERKMRVSSFKFSVATETKTLITTKNNEDNCILSTSG